MVVGDAVANPGSPSLGRMIDIRVNLARHIERDAQLKEDVRDTVTQKRSR